MLVTLSGIVMLVNSVQTKKARSPMLVTGLPPTVFGITSSPEAASLQSVMRTSPSVVVQVSQQSTPSLQAIANPFQTAPTSPKVACFPPDTIATAPSATPENA